MNFETLNGQKRKKETPDLTVRTRGFFLFFNFPPPKIFYTFYLKKGKKKIKRLVLFFDCHQRIIAHHTKKQNCLLAQIQTQKTRKPNPIALWISFSSNPFDPFQAPFSPSNSTQLNSTLLLLHFPFQTVYFPFSPFSSFH